MYGTLFYYKVGFFPFYALSSYADFYTIFFVSVCEFLFILTFLCIDRLFLYVFVRSINSLSYTLNPLLTLTLAYTFSSYVIFFNCVLYIFTFLGNTYVDIFMDFLLTVGLLLIKILIAMYGTLLDHWLLGFCWCSSLCFYISFTYVCRP